MYCDRCGQVDQSIAISALLSMDSGPQFSQSVGGIVHDGEYTPVMSTSVGRDSGLLNLQIQARKYANGQHYLAEIGSLQKTSTAIEANPQYKAGLRMLFIGFALILGGALVLALGQYVVGGLILVAGIGFITFGIKRADKGVKPIVQASQNSLTPEQKRHLKNISNGSYCRRCNVFSPEHD